MTTPIQQLYEIFLDHPSISTDSRSIAQGSIFFALTGDQFDGNQFAYKSLESGAAFAVVDNKEIAVDKRFLLVDNVLNSLQQLARFHRDHLKIPVIGITGSNGKTTTKELTGNILAKKFNTIWTQGNLNNHIGVPLTVLSIKGTTDIAVVEMGANHRGEIARLCQIANPDYGIITNIGKAHLEGFGSYEGVILAKSELYDHIRNSSGRLFVNEDDPLLMNLSEDIVRITYGKNEKVRVNGKITGEFPFLSLAVQFETTNITIDSQLTGSYNFPNLLAAASIGNHFGVDPFEIKEAAENYKPENNRSQFIKTQSNQIVMDAYNANPSSMEAAITHFAKYPASGKVLILGDMLELGGMSLAEHQRILELASESGADEILLIGTQFHKVSTNPAIQSFLTVDEAVSMLSKNPFNGKVILLKGSRGIRLEKLLPVL